MLQTFELTDGDREHLQSMLNRVSEGDAVLTAGEIHPDIPTIHNVGHRDGQRINVGAEVRHAGFGCFIADSPLGRISFDGGGAMQRAPSFSWTPLSGPVAEYGYDFDAAQTALESLLGVDSG